MLKRDLFKMPSKCARISFILFPVAVRLSKKSLIEMFSIGHYIREICALCLANFIVVHLSQTELVSLNRPHPFEYFMFAHDFRPSIANHRHKLKPLLAKLNSIKYSFFVNIVNEWNNLSKDVAEA